MIVWWVPFSRGSQVKSEVFMPYYVITSTGSPRCLFSLQAPKVTLRFKPSSQAVKRGGTHLCRVPALPQAGRQAGRQSNCVACLLSNSYLFPHIWWIHDRTCVLGIETMNHLCLPKLCRLNCEKKPCHDGNGCRSPMPFTLSTFLGGFMYITWQLHFREHNFSVNHNKLSIGQVKANFPAVLFSRGGSNTPLHTDTL